MLTAFVAAGFDGNAFWDLTPREFQRWLEGARQRQTEGHNNRAWLAHQTAFLTAYAPQKSREFPRLDRLLAGGSPKPRKAQTMEQQIAMAKAWAAATGGRA